MADNDGLKCVQVRIDTNWYYLMPTCGMTTDRKDAVTFVGYPEACKFAEDYIDSPVMLDVIDQISLKLF